MDNRMFDVANVRGYEYKLAYSAKLSRGEALLLLNTLEVFENSDNCSEKRRAALGAFLKYLEGRGIVKKNPTAVNQLKELKVAIIERLY